MKVEPLSEFGGARGFNSYLHGLADETIRESHERCRQVGIDQGLCHPLERADRRRMETLLRQHQAMISYCRLLFPDLHNDLKEETEVFLLTDHEAVILELYSSPWTLELLYRQHAFGPGVSLAESSCGTTATDLCLRHRRPYILHGDLYYCRKFQEWHTACAPVLDSYGHPRYAVGICSSDHASLGVKLALVRCIAREAQVFTERPESGSTLERPEHVQNSLDTGTISLTERQSEVLRLFATGMTYKEIARTIGLRSTKTVQEHLDAIKVKLGASHRRECIRRAMDHGLL